MAKTQDEINELLASDLFQKGIQDKYIIINEGNSIIRYNCKNQTKRRLQNPEEFVQAETYLKLIYEYNYPATNISVNESVQIGSETREADILVYNDSHNKILIVVECKEENINDCIVNEQTLKQYASFPLSKMDINNMRYPISAKRISPHATI